MDHLIRKLRFWYLLTVPPNCTREAGSLEPLLPWELEVIHLSPFLPHGPDVAQPGLTLMTLCQFPKALK